MYDTIKALIRQCMCYQNISPCTALVTIGSKMGLCNAQRRRGCYAFTGVVLAAIAVSMIIVGATGIEGDDNKSCSALVPWWNIVGGVFTILGLVGRLTLTRS